MILGNCQVEWGLTLWVYILHQLQVTVEVKSCLWGPVEHMPIKTVQKSTVLRYSHVSKGLKKFKFKAIRGLKSSRYRTLFV